MNDKQRAPSDQWHELWATFSVRDHCRPGAFVAEVLLYDKLVIPVLPTEVDGLTAADAERERTRWEDAGWDPERQKRLLDVLKHRAEQIPWTAQRQTEWRSEMAKGFADARRNGYFMSGSVLQKFAPSMAHSVVAVSQYHTLDQLRRAEKIRRREPDEKLPLSSLLAVVGHELLLPDEPDRDDIRVLETAARVASDPEYRHRRRALFDWQQKFAGPDLVTDARSIRAAVEEMTSLVEALHQAARRQARWRFAKRFFSFLGLGAEVGGLAGAPLAFAAKGASVLAAIGSYVVDEASGQGPSRDPAIPAATLVMDARETLGIGE